ncbi:uroporphyrinogen-III C-methyltransferase [Taibaiella koreensis]|uniref:uroporphyrinogen-III C-methyltransferase n=1 Tax=Taibaiella koreensis TaxID=1268548 RepID=UPI000E59A0FE|nr:uroporphyrinogen-III C-methyltransferase [Taibaiella koreensis]
METGKVILAGAGPGDPELLTLKAARYLQQADVVLADRLVSEGILYQWVQPRAEIIFVGKEGGNDQSTSQEDINALLVQYALEGKLVVRLKGGDVAFYANVLDELLALNRYSISYEIVPGISAASGASAYSGIPLTARNYAQSVRFLTLYNADQYTDVFWQELAHTADTLVLYMSGGQLGTIARKLSARGIAAGKMLALISQATTPQQSIQLWDIDKLAEQEHSSFISPSLIIIGKVVALHEQFGWFKPEAAEQSEVYFREIRNAQAASLSPVFVPK